MIVIQVMQNVKLVTTLRTASASWDYTMMKDTIVDIGKAESEDKE